MPPDIVKVEYNGEEEKEKYESKAQHSSHLIVAYNCSFVFCL